MPSLPPKGARIVFFSISASSARASALTVLSWASSESSWALVEAPPASSLRVRVAEAVARSRRACNDDSCARSTLASSSTRTWPGRTFAPESKRMARTSPGTSLLIVTPRPAATLPTDSSSDSHSAPFATAAPTASGGGPAAWAAFPKRIRDEI